MIVFSGSSNPDIAEELAHQLRCDVGVVEHTIFSNGELRPRIIGNVSGKDVVLVQTLAYSPHDTLVELLLLADALKRNKARNIVAVIPWMAYSLQNDIFQDGEPLSAEVIAKLVSGAGFSHIILLHPHAENIKKFFSIPVTVVSSIPLFGEEVKKLRSEATIVAPDKGGLPYARDFAAHLSFPLAYVDKTRNRSTGEVAVMSVSGDVEGKICVIVDDVINTGGTAADVASALKEHRAKRIMFYATHGLLAGDASNKLQNSAIDDVVVTDSIAVGKRAFRKLRIISVAPLLADAVRSTNAK